MVQPTGKNHSPDALFEVRGPDGGRAIVVVEAKQRVTAEQAAALVPRLEQAANQNNATGRLLVTSFLSPMARERLSAGGVSYFDLTGNARIVIDSPAIFVESRGADRNPEPLRTDSKSLKGGSAARIVRALCDWRPPTGVRELARRANTDPGYASRILKLLKSEDLISRDTRGRVVEVKWKDLLRQWARDYSVTATNRSFAFLEPRGVDALLRKLTNFKRKWALTGSLAVPRTASIASARTLSCYVESAYEAAEVLGLRKVEAGANVILFEGFDSIVWQRTRHEAGRILVATSQCAVDLLTGNGREPSQGDALLSWMEKNENAWRS